MTLCRVHVHFVEACKQDCGKQKCISETELPDGFMCIYSDIYISQIKLAISPSHSILTLGQPVVALTLQCQAPGKVATMSTKSKTMAQP